MTISRGLPGHYKIRRSFLVRISLILPVLVMIPACLAAFYALRCYSNGYYWGRVYMKNAPIRRGFDGTADELKGTTIVPSMKMPLPAHKNIIWTAALAIQWRDLRGQISSLSGFDGEMSSELDAASIVDFKARIEEQYTFIGPTKDATNTIAAEIHDAFPDTPASAINTSTDLVAFTYLRFNIAFPTRLAKDFFPAWGFKSSLGEWRRVSFFGLPPHGKQQAQILYVEKPGCCGSDSGEVIVDPSPQSMPYQVLLNRIPLQNDLASTIDYAEDRIASFSKTYPEPYVFDGAVKELSVPSLFFRIRNHSAEASGRFSDSDQMKSQTIAFQQTIEFELNHATPNNQSDRLASPGGVLCLPSSIGFYEPFLLLVRKRGTKEPVIVIWLDNAELISPRPPVWPSILRAFF
jgi:hypothetical protein